MPSGLIPETGVDLVGFIVALILAGGIVAGIGVGGWVAFRLVRVGLRWARLAFGR